MASILLPRRYSQKPPLGTGIDWSSSLAQGLIAPSLFMLEGGGSTLYDSQGQKNASMSNMTWKAGRDGVVPTFNGTTTAGTCAGPVFATSGSISLWVYPTFDVTVAAQRYCFDSTGTSRYLFGHNSSANCWFFYVNGTAVFDSTSSLSGMCPTNTWTHIGLTWTPTGGGIAYKNGVQFSTHAATLTAATPATFYIGERNSAASFWQGGLDQLLIWNRALSAADVQTLYAQPYGLLLPQRRLWAATAGGTAWTGTAAVTAAPTTTAGRLFVGLRGGSLTSSPGPTASRAQSALRSSTLTVAPTATDTRSQGTVRSAGNTIPPTTTAGRVMVLARTIGAIIAPVPSAVRGMVLARVVAPLATLSTTATRLASVARSGGATLAPGTTASRRGAFLRAASLTETVATTASRVLNAGSQAWSRVAAITVAPIPTAGRLVALLRSQSTGAGGGGQFLLGLGFLPGGASLISVSSTRAVSYLRALGPTLSPVTAATRLVSVTRAVAITLLLTPGAVRSTLMARAQAITATVSTTASRVYGALRSSSPSLSPVTGAARVLAASRSAVLTLTTTVGSARLVGALRTAGSTLAASIADSNVVQHAGAWVRSAGTSLFVVTAAPRTLVMTRSQVVAAALIPGASRVNSVARGGATTLITVSAGLRAAVLSRVASLSLVAVTAAPRRLVMSRSQAVASALTPAGSRILGGVRAVSIALSPLITGGSQRFMGRIVGVIIAPVASVARAMTLARQSGAVLDSGPAASVSMAIAALLNTIRRHFVVPARLFHYVVPPRRVHFAVPQRSFHFIVSSTPYALPAIPGDSDNTIGSTENNISYDIDFGPWLLAGEGLNGCSVTCSAVLRSNPTFDMTANAATFVISGTISGTKVVGLVDPHSALIGARYTLLFSATTSLGRTLTKPLQPLDCDR